MLLTGQINPEAPSTSGMIPLLVILGPTAVGKTDLAITLATALNGEIVGADSRQIYRQMDIGTAKPTAAQRAAIPHHLIDIADPDEEISLANFQAQANAAIHAIAARGKLPLLVGGTGQYITALLEGWTPPNVAPNPVKRAALEAEAAEHGVPALAERLRALDPDAMTVIDPRNLRRIIRALEVIDATGQPFSAQRTKSPPPYRARLIGLNMDRERLKQRADQRLEQMLATGFVDEVRALLDHGYAPPLPSMSAVGYGQVSRYVQGEITREEALQLAKHATHIFIRRQLSWFRGHDPGILWQNMEMLTDSPLLEALGDWYREKV